MNDRCRVAFRLRKSSIKYFLDITSLKLARILLIWTTVETSEVFSDIL